MSSHNARCKPWVSDIKLSSEPSVSKTIIGSFIAAVGWIPYLDVGLASKQGLPGAYRTYDWHGRFISEQLSPFVPLFYSGNVSRSGSPENPDPEKLDESDLLTLCATKNFRLAMAVESVTVHWDVAGFPTSVEFTTIFAPGYTPFPVPPFPPALRPTFDSDPPEMEIAPDVIGPYKVEISFSFALRLGKFANKLGRIATGHDAPKAWALATLIVGKEAAELAFSGSALPSQSGYNEGLRVNFHDMLLCSEAEIRAFIEAGDDVMAPEWDAGERWFAVPASWNPAT